MCLVHWLVLPGGWIVVVKRRWTRREVDEYRRVHGSFYFNKMDANIIVPPYDYDYGSGYILNYAHPICWIILCAGIAAVIAIFILGANLHHPGEYLD